MPAPYRIFGIELSPYSVKVRSYFRYKGIPHEWVVRHMGNMEEFQKFAKLPLVPLVITPGRRRPPGLDPDPRADGAAISRSPRSSRRIPRSASSRP